MWLVNVNIILHGAYPKHDKSAGLGNLWISETKTCYQAETQNVLFGFPKTAARLEKPSCHHISVRSLSMKGSADDANFPAPRDFGSKLPPKWKVTLTAP